MHCHGRRKAKGHGILGSSQRESGRPECKGLAGAFAELRVLVTRIETSGAGLRSDDQQVRALYSGQPSVHGRGGRQTAMGLMPVVGVGVGTATLVARKAVSLSR